MLSHLGFQPRAGPPQAQGRMNSSLDALEFEGNADTTQDRGLISPPHHLPSRYP